MPEPICRGCSSPLAPSAGTKPRSWCSDRCRVATFRRVQPLAPGAWTTASKDAARSRVYFPRCLACDNRFTTRCAGVELCSDDCRRERARAAGRESAKRNGYWQKRRALLRSQPAESINPVVLAERDDWACGICSLAIDQALTFPHTGSLSVDHIVPISLGGPHTWDNVRAAHLGCNAARGNRVA